MQARRVLSLSAIALTSACLSVAMLGACGGDDSTIIYVYLEAGPQDSGKRDGTTIIDDDSGDQPTTCEPQKVPAFTFKSPGKYLGKCTDDMLSQLFDGCLVDGSSIDGCKQLQDQLKDCATCTFGSPTDLNHPWLQYDEQVTAFPNYGLCMATIRDESKPTDCGVAYGQFYPCLNAACVTTCKAIQSSDAFDACRQAALDQGICTAGAQTAIGSKCAAVYEATDPTYGFCTSIKDEQGKQLTEKDYMIRLARLTCGNDPNPDGGVKDGGSDASDAGDAGDADADANP